MGANIFGPVGPTELCKHVPKDGGMIVFNAKVGTWRTVAYRHRLSVYIFPHQATGDLMHIYLMHKRGNRKVEIT